MLILTDLPISLWAALAFSSLVAGVVIKSRLNYLSLPEIETHSPTSEPPDCMVVIPARNEEALVGRAVKSLPPDSVLVVDDDSTDNTVEAARAAGAGILPAPKLGKGANGKSNACAEGARVLTSKWILFADADTHYQPGFLESVVATAESRKVDFVSVYLRPEFATLGEMLSGPVAGVLYFFGINPRANPAGAFLGQCVLVRREAYEFVGGHGTVIKDLCEDVKLVALAQRHRMKFAVVRADYLGRVRIRTEGLARRMHRFTQVSPFIGLRIMLGAAVLACWAPVTAWLLADHQPVPAAALALWPVLLLSGRYEGIFRALLAPFGVYTMLLRGTAAALGVLTGRAVEWKGRVI